MTDRARRRATSRTPALHLVALGALCAAEDRLGDVVGSGTAGVRRVGRSVVSTAVPLVPSSLRRVVAETAAQLDEQGRSAVTTGAEDAARVAAALAESLGQHPTIVHVIEHVIDNLKSRVVDAVLPVVLERLSAEPEQVQVIIQGQSRGMLDEFARTARGRAAEGDEMVDALVNRILRRRRPPRGAALGRAEPVGAQPLPSQP